MKKLVIFIFIVTLSKLGYSQLNPMGSIYYHNQYVANPAMAGIAEGWELNAAYKSQWSVISNALSMQTVSAAYGSTNKKVGFGLLLYNDVAGVVQNTSVKATYAFHMPLSNDGATILDFGLSAGFMDEHVNQSKVIGDVNDIDLNNYNDRKLYLDADFGIALRAKELTIQGSIPNLKRYLNKDIKRNLVDRSLMMGAISYKFIIKNRKLNSIEPKFVYRSVENYKDIVDLGANFVFNESKLLLSGIYHTTGSYTFGAGTLYKKKLTILAQYTTNTSELGNYSNGEAEIALKYKF